MIAQRKAEAPRARRRKLILLPKLRKAIITQLKEGWLLTTVRDHWLIENALHWQLDISFREDAARNRKDNAPGNIAVLRRRALDVPSG